MIESKLRVIALCLCLPLVVVASPAAARNTSKAGHDARAQAIEPLGTKGISPHRADALRECSTESGKLLQKDWGVRQSSNYGACMTSHGEIE